MAKDTSFAPVEEEIDIKVVLQTLKRNRTAVVVFAIISTLIAALYAYSQPNIYQASTSIELQPKSRSSDILAQAVSGDTTSLENEQFILKSRFMAGKVLKYLDLGTRYFTEEHWRQRELYKSSPFVVNTFFMDQAVYGKEIKLMPVNKTTFRLKIEPPSKWNFLGLKQFFGIVPKDNRQHVTYNGLHHFGDTIATPWFKIRVDQISKLSHEKYSFRVLPNEAMGWMVQSGIKTNIEKGSSILILSKMDRVPLRAKEIVNALADVYLNVEIERKNEQADMTLKFIDQQLKAINEALRSSQKSLEEFKQSNTVLDISQKASETTAKLSEYGTKIQEIEMEQSILSNLQQYMEQNEDPSGIVMGAASLTGANLSAMINELKKKALEREALLIEYTELHPDVIKLSELINQLRKSILFSINSSLTVLQQRKQSIEKLVEEYQTSLEALPQQEQQLSNLMRKASVNENIYSYLLQKRAETAIVRSSTVSNNQVIDAALTPGGHIMPNRPLITIIGLVVGIVLGIAYAFLFEFLDNTIKRKDELDRLTNIPLYGVVPNVSTKGKKFGGMFLEAFRSLRTNLEFMRNDKKYQSIVVTSTVSGEGKTTIAANLAVVYGKSDKKVVVVDLDMRRAKLSEYFGLENESGVSTLLSKKNTLDDVIQHTEKNVDIIAAGPTPPNPSELIMSDYAKEVMDILRKRYDYIILDTPPVGIVTDAAILMNRADVSLLVVKYDYTKREFVKGLDQLVRDHHLEHVGLVFNGVDLNKKNYDYGYGYGYASSQKYGNKYGASKYYTET